MQLANKSITGADAREQAWQLLQELRKVIDPANQAEHQLLTLDLTLVTADGQQGAVEAKAAALGAQVTVEDDDLCAPPMSQGACGLGIHRRCP